MASSRHFDRRTAINLDFVNFVDPETGVDRRVDAFDTDAVWQCGDCGALFSPDEANTNSNRMTMNCPVCDSPNIDWTGLSHAPASTRSVGRMPAMASRKTAATSSEVAAIVASFGAESDRVQGLADLMEYGPKYNRNVTENVLYAMRFSGDDREYYLRKAEAQAHFDRTGEWIPPIHPRDKGQQLSMEFESRRRTASAFTAEEILDMWGLSGFDVPGWGDPSTIVGDFNSTMSNIQYLGGFLQRGVTDDGSPVDKESLIGRVDDQLKRLAQLIAKAESQGNDGLKAEMVMAYSAVKADVDRIRKGSSRRRTAAAEWTEVESQFLGNYPEYRARINGFTIILKWVVTQGNFEWRAWAGDPATFDSDGYVKFNFSDRLYDAKKSAERWASQRTASRRGNKV